MLPALALAAVQLATRVGPVVTVSQVMSLVAEQLPTGTGVQVSEAALHERSCDVLWRTCEVLRFTWDVLCSSWNVLVSVCDVLRRICAVL